MRIAISRGSVLNNFDDTVKTLTGGIGQISNCEGDDVINVVPYRTDKPAQ